MFTLIICVFLVLYCLRNMLYINNFVAMLDEPVFPLLDAIIIIFSVFWFVLQIFLYSGPVVVIVALSLVIWDNNVKAPWPKRLKTTRLLLAEIAVLNIIIGVNHLHFQFSMWNKLFKLFS